MCECMEPMVLCQIYGPADVSERRGEERGMGKMTASFIGKERLPGL